MATIDKLSDDILVHIFQYLLTEDLLLSVSQVNNRWQHIIRDQITSKMKNFTPPPRMTDEQIVNSLKILPNIRNFRLQHGDDVEKIMDVLCLHCRNIRKIILDCKLAISQNKIGKITETYKKLRELKVYAPVTSVRLDFAKHLGHKYKNVSLGLKSSVRHPSYYPQSMPNCRFIPEDGIKNAIDEIRGSIEYLSVGAKISQQIWDAIHFCPKIKHLLLMVEEGSTCFLDLLSLTELENLEWLQIITSIHINIPNHRIYPPYFDKLACLEIFYKGSLYGNNLRRLWEVCPKLERLRIKTDGLSDKDFEGIHNCVFLKYVDLSENVPGLHNDCLKHIGKGCYRLEFLDMSYSGTKFIYDIMNLRACTKLRFLWLTKHFVSDDNLIGLPEMFHKLKEINFESSRNRREILENLRAKMPTLKINVNVRKIVEEERIIGNQFY